MRIYLFMALFWPLGNAVRDLSQQRVTGRTGSADSAAKKVFLGRPWRPYARTVFLRTEMGGHITPEGWDNWRNPENEKTAYYAEYGDTGPGAAIGGRATWSRQLTAAEAKKYTVENILGTWVAGNHP